MWPSPAPVSTADAHSPRSETPARRAHFYSSRRAQLGSPYNTCTAQPPATPCYAGRARPLTRIPPAAKYRHHPAESPQTGPSLSVPNPPFCQVQEVAAAILHRALHGCYTHRSCASRPLGIVGPRASQQIAPPRAEFYPKPQPLTQGGDEDEGGAGEEAVGEEGSEEESPLVCVRPWQNLSAKEVPPHPGLECSV